MASGVHVVLLSLETLASQLVISRFASVGQDRHRKLTIIVVGFGWVMTQLPFFFFSFQTHTSDLLEDINSHLVCGRIL